ncbi:Mannan polymerase II complex anp1 subunit [Bulinus truncatus]|nr:Mannan polymerase II complex anp1 subunit [Bulinus truncatus]
MNDSNNHYLLEGYKFEGDGIDRNSSWRKGEQIGWGSSCEVYRAEVKVRRQVVDIVVKYIKTDNRKSYRHKKAAMDEIRALEKLNKLSHVRVVKLFGHCIKDFAIYIFMEPMQQSLSDFIEEKGALDQHEVSRFTKQICEGVQYLKENRIIHSDIKSANILMNDKENIKLADFGVSKMFMTLSQAQTASTGTVKYMAPEMFTGEVYSYPVDVWAIGCVVVEMSTGGELFPDKEGQQIHTIMAGPAPSPLNYLKTLLSHETKQFLLSIFQKDPLSRPTAKDLLNHKFVQVYRREDINQNMNKTLLYKTLIIGSETDYTEVLSKTVLNKSILYSESSDEESEFKYSNIRIHKDTLNVYNIPNHGFIDKESVYDKFHVSDDSDESSEYISNDLSATVLNRSTDSDLCQWI